MICSMADAKVIMCWQAGAVKRDRLWVMSVGSECVKMKN